MFIRSFLELESIITLGETTESLILEFKREVNYKKENIYEEIALDICQFANSLGGVIIFGLEEKVNESGKRVASTYVNFDFDCFSKFLNDKILPIIYPKDIRLSIFSVDIRSGVCIAALNILPLAMGLACVSSSGPPYYQRYPYRTHYGKKYYSPLEVERVISNPYRYMYIRLNEFITAVREVVLYPSIKKEEPSRKLSWDTKELTVLITDIGESEYTLSVAGLAVNIPYGITRDVWMTENKKIGLLISASLVISSDRKNVYFDRIEAR